MKRTLLLTLLFSTTCVMAQSLTITLNRTAKKGVGAAIGTVTFKDAYRGLLITPHLHGLTPGLHGFHIHQHPSCANAGMAAGGHLDPKHTGKHLGPYNSKGHLGDLPALYVDTKGRADLPVFAPRLHVYNLYNHAVMIHQGGDNYSDTPEKLGGGGERIACAVVLPQGQKKSSNG